MAKQQQTSSFESIDKLFAFGSSSTNTSGSSSTNTSGSSEDIASDGQGGGDDDNAGLIALLFGATVAGQGAATGFDINAIRNKAQFNKGVLDFRADLSRLRAKQAIQRGREQQVIVGQQTSQLISRQRTALASSGLEIDEGSSLRLQEETAKIGALEQLTVRNNAALQAWGLRAQADVAEARGDFIEQQAKDSAIGRYISLAGDAVSLGFIAGGGRIA